MSLMRMPWTIRGQFVSGAAMVAIFAMGCTDGGFTSGGGSGDLVGTIVNSNKDTDLIGGVRLKSGEGAFAYGAWKTDGSVDEIDSIVYADASGKQSTLYLESGRPSKLVGPDGSRVEVTYTEVSSSRLAGSVTLTPAGQDAQTFDFDIDLQLTAQQIAQIIQQYANVQVTTDAAPSDSTNTKAVNEDTTGTSTGEKSNARQNLAIVVPVVFVVTGYALNLILGQLLKAIVVTASAIVKSFAVAILTPFIFMGNLMRLALGEPLITIDYNQPNIVQGPVVITIPRPTPF